MLLLTDAFADDPALEMAVSSALLQAVGRGEHEPCVRVYRPGSTLAFGRRDTLLDGYPAALEAARAAGFTPVVRSAGGRAAAYDAGCLLVEEVLRVDGSVAGLHTRFDAHAARLALVLQRLGLPAQVGELPGEYCPGAHSVHLDGQIKVAGVAQRVVSGAALVSSVLVVGPGDPIRAVISAVYEALGLPLDPARTGALADVDPAVDIEAVTRALAAAFAPAATLGDMSAKVLAHAGSTITRHGA